MRPRMVPTMVSRAFAKVSLPDEAAANDIADALDGRKISGKRVAADVEDGALILDDLDETNVTGRLIGEAKGQFVVFNTRETLRTPVAVAWVDNNEIQGMFLLGADDFVPTAEEIGWASRVVDANANVEREAELSAFRLPKRWINRLMRAATQAEASDEVGQVATSLSLLLLFAGVAFFIKEFNEAPTQQQDMQRKQANVLKLRSQLLENGEKL